MFWLKRVGGESKSNKVRITDVGTFELENNYICVEHVQDADFLISEHGRNLTGMVFEKVEDPKLPEKPIKKEQIFVNTYKKEKMIVNPNRNVLIVTAFTKGYDLVSEYLHPVSNYHYLCYTNDYKFTSDFFVVSRLPEGKTPEENVRLARGIKLNLSDHLTVSDYDYIIWLDANCSFIREVDSLIDDLGDDDVAIFGHRERNCLYSEAKACIRYKKDSQSVINKQVKKYKKEGFPSNYGMWATHCIVYRPTREALSFFKIWYAEVTNHSYRDQISLPYALKKSKVKFHTLLNAEIFSVEWFKYVSIRGHCV